MRHSGPATVKLRRTPRIAASSAVPRWVRGSSPTGADPCWDLNLRLVDGTICIIGGRNISSLDIVRQRRKAKPIEVTNGSAVTVRSDVSPGTLL